MSRRLLKDIVFRRIPQIVGIYLAGGWGLLEFTDWAVLRFSWSPTIPDAVIGLWLASLPVVVALAWRFGAPGPQHGPIRQSPESSKSVAVLPFDNLSDTQDDSHLADGLAEEITAVLARVPELNVASRTSAFAYRDAREDVRTIGRALGVGAVLEGSLQRSGDRLRVTTQLISVTDGYHLWSAQFDRDASDWFEIEDEIAANVALALRVILADPGRRARARIPNSDFRAYEFYLRGRQYLYQIRRKSLGYARDMFERAIAVDPEYALAYAGLADAHSTMRIFYPESDSDLEAARQATIRALELDSELAEAHSARGTLLSLLERHDEAGFAFETAIRLDPRLWEARYYYARARFQAGDFARAATLFEEANHIRDDADSAFFAAQSYEALGRRDEARIAYRRANEAAERQMALHPDDARTATIRAVALCRTGHADEGLVWAERALMIDPEDAGIRYNVACLYAVEGRLDQALDCLTRALRAGFGKREWLDRDPDIDALRDHPRFKTLMVEMDSRG